MKGKSIGLMIFRLLVAGAFVAFVGCETVSDDDLGGGQDENPNGGAASGDASPGGGGGSDAISLSGVVWLDQDVSGWSRTATLNASVSGGAIQLNYDKANVWPTARTRASDGGPLVGNCWVFVNVGGTWHAATFDWMRSGQTAKAVSSVRGTGGHIPHAPLSSWTPSSGQTYGFMVTTPARGGERTINERSNVSMVTWP